MMVEKDGEMMIKVRNGWMRLNESTRLTEMRAAHARAAAADVTETEATGVTESEAAAVPVTTEASEVVDETEEEATDVTEIEAAAVPVTDETEEEATELTVIELTKQPEATEAKVMDRTNVKVACDLILKFSTSSYANAVADLMSLILKLSTSSSDDQTTHGPVLQSSASGVLDVSTSSSSSPYGNAKAIQAETLCPKGGVSRLKAFWEGGAK